jgi:hypothetical protein
MEPIALTALILSIIAGISSLIIRLHLKKCKMCCFNSECSNTPKNTPDHSQKDLDINTLNKPLETIETLIKLYTPKTERRNNVSTV